MFGNNLIKQNVIKKKKEEAKSHIFKGVIMALNLIKTPDKLRMVSVQLLF